MEYTVTCLVVPTLVGGLVVAAVLAIAIGIGWCINKVCSKIPTPSPSSKFGRVAYCTGRWLGGIVIGLCGLLLVFIMSCLSWELGKGVLSNFGITPCIEVMNKVPK